MKNFEPWCMSFFLQGHCYVWALSSGEPKESSKLLPKNKILAHEGRSGLKFNAEAWAKSYIVLIVLQACILWSYPRYSLCCQFSPDSSLLVTTSADHTAKLWRTSDFTLVQVSSRELFDPKQLLTWNCNCKFCFSLQELTCPDQRWVWDAAFTADSQ